MRWGNDWASVDRNTDCRGLMLKVGKASQFQPKVLSSFMHTHLTSVESLLPPWLHQWEEDPKIFWRIIQFKSADGQNWWLPFCHCWMSSYFISRHLISSLHHSLQKYLESILIITFDDLIGPYLDSDISSLHSFPVCCTLFQKSSYETPPSVFGGLDYASRAFLPVPQEVSLRRNWLSDRFIQWRRILLNPANGGSFLDFEKQTSWKNGQEGSKTHLFSCYFSRK